MEKNNEDAFILEEKLGILLKKRKELYNKLEQIDKKVDEIVKVIIKVRDKK